MNAAYNRANGISGHDLTEEMIFALPDYVFAELRTAVESQEKADSTRTIETQALKGKKLKKPRKVKKADQTMVYLVWRLDGNVKAGGYVGAVR